MAISSVTKRFVINDDKACIALAKALKKIGQSLFLCDYPNKGSYHQAKKQIGTGGTATSERQHGNSGRALTTGADRRTAAGPGQQKGGGGYRSGRRLQQDRVRKAVSALTWMWQGLRQQIRAGFHQSPGCGTG